MDRETVESSSAREYCRSRLASIVSAGLRPLPSCVLELDAFLTEPVVDLLKVTAALHSDPAFSLRVLQLANAVLNPSHEFAQTIPDAVVLLGPDLFHAAVLLCAVTEFGPRAKRNENAQTLWSHSVQMGMLSAGIAAQSAYPSRGRAYVAGLLHDMGSLPLLMIAREQQETSDEVASLSWWDNVELERDIFGLDHCELGRWMAKVWEFSPSLTDAVLFHHDPSKAETDSHLAEIVCAAEYYCSEPEDRELAAGQSIADRQNLPN